MSAAAPPALVESPGIPLADDWVALSDQVLPLDVASAWVVRPHCGAVVIFFGTVRDHAEGRPGVTGLAYEAYVAAAQARMATIALQARRRWADLGRVVVWHRTGALQVTDIAVVVAVGSPHRAEAFDAARWVIDTVKTSVPIWKSETWSDGRDWGVDTRPIEEVPS